MYIFDDFLAYEGFCSTYYSLSLTLCVLHFRCHSFRPPTKQHHQRLGKVGEAQLRGDRRTAAAEDPMVHERSAGGRRGGRRRWRER